MDNVDPIEHAIEECAEVIHALQKGKRFGWDNYHPDRPRLSNRDAALNECAQLRKALIRVENLLDV